MRVKAVSIMGKKRETMCMAKQKESFMDATWLNERNKALIKAGEGIVAARKSLDQLEDVLRGTAMGKFPNIGDVADTTHKMREQIDQILIGLVESCMDRSTGRQKAPVWRMKNER